MLEEEEVCLVSEGYMEVLDSSLHVFERLCVEQVLDVRMDAIIEELEGLYEVDHAEKTL